MKRAIAVSLAAAALMVVVAPAYAAEITIKERNQTDDGKFVFEDALVRIKPGDTVVFEPADRGHNAETIPGMLPAGAAAIKTPFSKEARVTFETPGVYGIKCLPHFGLGMVAVIVVGDPVNLAEVKQAAEKLPPMAKARAAKLLAELG